MHFIRGILAGDSSFAPSGGDAGDDGRDPSDRFNSLKEQLGQRRETEKQDIDALNAQLLQSQMENLGNANGTADTEDPNISNGTDPQTPPASADQAFSFILPDASAQQNNSQGQSDPTLGGLLAP